MGVLFPGPYQGQSMNQENEVVVFLSFGGWLAMNF